MPAPVKPYRRRGVHGAVQFESGNNSSQLIAGGSDRSPILASYDPQDNLIQHLLTTQSQGDAHFGEISISNNTVYIDCEIVGGPHTFGSDTFTSVNNTKDGVILSIGL